MAVRRPSPRYATKAAVARRVECVREIGLDVAKRAVEFLPDAGIRFVPEAPRPIEEVDTWGDL